MAPDGRLVQVEIFGQTYRLRADEDPEYVETLAAYVDGKMREISRQTTAVDTLKVAVLTALNIADDHLRLRPEDERRAQSEGRERQQRRRELPCHRVPHATRVAAPGLPEAPRTTSRPFLRRTRVSSL